MADRLVAVDDSDFLLPQPVRDAYLSDIQTKLDTAVTNSVAAMPNIAQAVSDKLAPLTADTAVAPLLDSATTTRGKLDGRYRTVSVVAVDSAGSTDYTTPIQTALNTGQDVLVVCVGTSVGIAKTTATLVMKSTAPGQRFTTSNAYLAPAFVGDAVQVTTQSECKVQIRGSQQPSSGDYSNVAAIRIGGTSSNYNPQQASVAYSDVRSFKGSAIIWDQGSMIDFSHFHADTVTGDGIRGTSTYDDNHHGWFANTHIVHAAGKGYAFYGDGSNLSANSSRHHVLQDAKAFGCGQNFYIEARSIVGTVYSELGGTADVLGSTARGCKIDVIETAASFEAWSDTSGMNEVSGFSQNNRWETKRKVIRNPVLGSTAYSAITSGQVTVSSRSIAAGGYSDVSSGVSGLGTGRAVRATLFTSTGGGIVLHSYIDAGGALHFELYNHTSSAKTVSGTISYEVWRFA